MNLLYAAVYALVGRNHIAAIRAVLILVVWATGIAIARTAVLLQDEPDAAIAGMLYVGFSSAGQPRDALAANTELFLNLPLALAALVIASLVAARGRARGATGFAWRHDLFATLAAGALTGVAGLFKYQAALAGLAWVAALVHAEPRSARTVTRLSGLAVGFLTVAAALCAWFYIEGDWNAFLFWGWSYNFRYIDVLTTAEKIRSFADSTAWILLFWGALVALATAAARSRKLVVLTAAWLAAASLSIWLAAGFSGSITSWGWHPSASRRRLAPFTW